MKNAFSGILVGNVETVAPRLLGAVLRREIDGEVLMGKIVEVEAYCQEDAASHSYKGKTQRNAVMFGPAGHLYVYFTYGMHYCCNVVVGEAGYGAAVLIRAVEPLAGVDCMLKNRNGRAGVGLTNGPAKVCQAFGIDTTLNGHDLSRPPLTLIMPTELVPTGEIISSSRIGIRQAVDVPWRFHINGNAYVSV